MSNDEDNAGTRAGDQMWLPMRRAEWFFAVRPDELVDLHDASGFPFLASLAVAIGSVGASALIGYYQLITSQPTWLAVLGWCLLGTGGLTGVLARKELNTVRKITKRIMERHDLTPLKEQGQLPPALGRLPGAEREA